MGEHEPEACLEWLKQPVPLGTAEYHQARVDARNALRVLAARSPELAGGNAGADAGGDGG